MGGPRIPSFHSQEHGTVHKLAHTLPGLEIELATLRRSYPNVLLIGPDAANERVLSELLPHCRTPIHEPNPDLAIPVMARGTLVLRQVESMSAHEQLRLHQWFGRACGGIQIVSLASPRLFERVSTDAFKKGLFYRLNVIVLMTSGH